MSDKALIQLSNIEHSYAQGGKTVNVLKGIDLSLSVNEITALVGASGSGKSTLLHLAGLLEKPTSGTIMIDGVNTNHISERKKTHLRRDTIGFIYQFHYLQKEFTALENVLLPQLAKGISRAKAEAHAKDLLGELGLSDRLNHRPGQLSGGEQQRVSIARALANNPRIILADEPTGNLDEKTADQVFKSLVDVVKNRKTSLLMVTHNPSLADRAHHAYKLESGLISKL